MDVLTHSQGCCVRARRGGSTFTTRSEPTERASCIPNRICVFTRICTLPLGDLGFHFRIYLLTMSPTSASAILAWKRERVAYLRRRGFNIWFFIRGLLIIRWCRWLLIRGLRLICAIGVCGLRCGVACGRSRRCRYNRTMGTERLAIGSYGTRLKPCKAAEPTRRFTPSAARGAIVSTSSRGG